MFSVREKHWPQSPVVWFPNVLTQKHHVKPQLHPPDRPTHREMEKREPQPTGWSNWRSPSISFLFPFHLLKQLIKFYKIPANAFLPKFFDRYHDQQKFPVSFLQLHSNELWFHSYQPPPLLPPFPPELQPVYYYPTQWFPNVRGNFAPCYLRSELGNQSHLFYRQQPVGHSFLQIWIRQ